MAEPTISDSLTSESGIHLVEGPPLPYLLSVPADGGASRGPLPVLCFLHGYDEGAPMETRAALTRHGPLRPGTPSGVLRDFLVVAPQLPRRGDLWHRHAGDVRRIVAGVRDEHGGDPERTYLSGFSFGGNGVFDLALAQPGFWAALWPVDPTRVPRADPGRPVWLSFGQVARHGKASFLRALGLAPADAAPGGDRLYLDEGHDHVGSATSAYRDERIYAWLLSKRLGV
jgi:poly(3-hydroxybutyrate) depolymerase